MVINKQRSGDTLTIAPEGRLDTVTSPELEKAVKGSLDGVTELIFDLAKHEGDSCQRDDCGGL